MRFADRAHRMAKSPWLRLLAVIGLAGLAAASLVPDRDRLPHSPFPGQIEHFLAYAAVAAIAGLAFGRYLRLRVLLLIIALYAGLLEFAQRWAPERTPSLLDFAASAAGAAVGIALCALMFRVIEAMRRL